MTLLDLLQQDGITLKKAAGTNGGEYAGPCPSCGGTDRFRLWPEQGNGGKYWCRGCSKQGDAIQYLRDFRKLKYLEACLLLGQEPKHNGKRSLNWDRQSRYEGGNPASWQPKESTLPGVQWAQKAGQFVAWAEQQLWTTDQGKQAREWLHGRGLSEETAKTYRLGWNPQHWWPKREAWELPTVLKEDGKPKKLWLPLGMVIPKIRDEIVITIKIRLPQPPVWNPGLRYYLLPGSITGPLIIPGGPACCVVVESELDAILLHQEAGHLCTALALGSASNRPDQAAAALLDQAETVLVSLDSDEAGAKAAWQWWAPHFPRSKRWPVVKGKDPTEARQNGLDLRAWILAGLNPGDEIKHDLQENPDKPGRFQWEALGHEAAEELITRTVSQFVSHGYFSEVKQEEADITSRFRQTWQQLNHSAF